MSAVEAPLADVVLNWLLLVAALAGACRAYQTCWHTCSSVLSLLESMRALVSILSASFSLHRSSPGHWFT